MNCHNHPLRQGVNTCSKCGRWLCEECTTESDGRVYCVGCLRAAASGRVDTRRSAYVPNILLLLMFSGLPGANYMYMGLIKRGLFVMMSFFMSIYLTTFFGFFGFVIAGIGVTSFFDGLRIRRRFIACEPVSDGIDDLKAFFSENKFPIVAVTVVLMAMEILQNTARFFRYGIGYGMAHFDVRGIMALAAVALGVYLLSKLLARKTPVRRDRDLQ